MAFGRKSRQIQTLQQRNTRLVEQRDEAREEAATALRLSRRQTLKLIAVDGENDGLRDALAAGPAGEPATAKAEIERLERLVAVKDIRIKLAEDKLADRDRPGGDRAVLPAVRPSDAVALHRDLREARQLLAAQQRRLEALQGVNERHYRSLAARSGRVGA